MSLAQRMAELAAPKSDGMQRLRTVSKHKPLLEVLDDVLDWFEGKPSNTKKKSVIRLSASLDAIRSAYDLDIPKTAFRCASIKLPSKNITDEQAMKLKSFVVGEIPLSSWTRSAAAAERFYKMIRKPDFEPTDKERKKKYDWMYAILEADISKYALITHESAEKFVRDMIDCYDELVAEKILPPKIMYYKGDKGQSSLSRVKYVSQRVSRPFIKKQEEIICLLPSSRKIPCRIHKILQRGPVPYVKVGFNYPGKRD